jgi:hypothetical protein
LQPAVALGRASIMRFRGRTGRQHGRLREETAGRVAQAERALTDRAISGRSRVRRRMT